MSSPKSNASSTHAPPSDSSGNQSQVDRVLATDLQTGIIEVDPNDTDSSYPESSRVTDTSSLRSSILNYKWENGRRYHAYQDGEYWAPNDEQQQDAEDLMHELHRIVLDGRLYVAPISDSVQSVLDVGCGTGIWAIQFADENPSAEVVGVDLSPIQPSFVPINCRFEVDDMNEDWTFPDNNFEFIHLRVLNGCVPDWVEFHKKVLRHLKPGGWVEQVELSCITNSDDGTLKADSPFITWQDVFDKLGTALGKTFFAGENARENIKEAGFVNITERRIKIPIGTWPKDPTLKQWGAWNRQFLIQGLEGFSIRGLTDVLGWTFEDAQMFLVQMREALTDSGTHGYIIMRVLNGQKPEE